MESKLQHDAVRALVLLEDVWKRSLFFMACE
jgi:hypothetical protein